VLGIAAFRRLWIALSLSSLGDWLGLLATTSLAQTIISQGGGSYAAQNFAVGGVVILRLLPALLLGPFAGAVADRFDRRMTMVIADLLRFALFVSIPLSRSVTWLLIASFLIEAVTLFWIPAKEASVPNLVPRQRLEAANQLSLLTTYGSAPIAAGVFAMLALFNTALAAAIPFFSTNPVDLALYFNAATFLFSAATIYQLREIPKHARRADGEPAGTADVIRSIVEGWRFVGGNRMVRGLVVGMLGAFAAGGAVIGVGRVFVDDLDAGDAGYGVLFGAVFLGLALGMVLGPRLLAGLSRRRMFGASIVAAGITLALIAIVGNLVLVVLLVLFLGLFAGVGWVTGYTLLGLEVEDAVRGRTFAFVQSMARVELLLVLAAVPFAAGVLGEHALRLGEAHLRLNGAALTLLIAALLGTGVGVIAYRQMDDHRAVSLWAELLAVLRGEPELPGRGVIRGFFVAVEGGEGAGKSTQIEHLQRWLRELGHPVAVTREPGATPVGRRLRALLLDPRTGALAPRTEALLYAADRAEHVERVIRPALARGAVVLSDRYVDSSLAYQGAGRTLPAEEVARLSRWATGGLVPDLTVLLDVAPAVGLARIGGQPDRLEAEPAEFHNRVRQAFRDLAQREPQRYLVVDAGRPAEEVAAQIRIHLAPLLPAPPATASGVPEDTTRPVPMMEAAE
jgi:dTMP kinase